MTIMLPSPAAACRSVVGVAAQLRGALAGEADELAAVRSAVLVVIDGLGAVALRAHAGHARFLAGAMGKKDVATSVFPTTTAAALTSIVTGTAPGEHGLVGYRVRHPDTGVVLNQLTDWEKAGLDPATWQRSATLFEQAAGHPVFAVGLSQHVDSGFTRAVLRGAEYLTARSARERVVRAYELAASNPGALVYCYLPDTDKTGHKQGMASAEWLAALEEIDTALRAPVPPGVGVLVTSDHGMIDVPAHRQFIVDPGHDAREGVVAIAGEPRMLHLYLESDAAAAAARWRAMLDGIADVATREEAIAAGVFGPRVDAAVRPRIGDLLVIARGNRAIYDGADAEESGRAMVGQHGAWTPEERTVPYIRLGDFAR